MNISLINHLDGGCQHLDLSLTKTQKDLILSYVTLLIKWNKHYNLTAIESPVAVLSHHVLDSLSVLNELTGINRLCDVGTGAGLPGLILAICRPGQSHVLLDGNGKKIRFLVQAIHELGLNNVEAVHARAEDYQTAHCFDGIISRAVGTLAELIRVTQHLRCPQGRWYAMKGQVPIEELQAIQQPYQIKRLDVPMMDAERHLVTIEG